MPRLSSIWINVYFGLCIIWITTITEIDAAQRIGPSPGLKDTRFVSTNILGESDVPQQELDNYDYLLQQFSGDFGIKSAVVLAASEEPEYKGVDTLVLPLYIPKGAVPIRLARIARSGNPDDAPTPESVLDLKVGLVPDVLLRRVGSPGGGPRVFGTQRVRNPIPQRQFWPRHSISGPSGKVSSHRRSDSLGTRRAIKKSREHPTLPPTFRGRWGQRLNPQNNDEDTKRSKKNELSKQSQFTNSENKDRQNNNTTANTTKIATASTTAATTATTTTTTTTTTHSTTPETVIDSSPSKTTTELISSTSVPATTERTSTTKENKEVSSGKSSVSPSTSTVSVISAITDTDSILLTNEKLEKDVLPKAVSPDILISDATTIKTNPSSSLVKLPVSTPIKILPFPFGRRKNTTNSNKKSNNKNNTDIKQDSLKPQTSNVQSNIPEVSGEDHKQNYKNKSNGQERQSIIALKPVEEVLKKNSSVNIIKKRKHVKILGTTSTTLSTTTVTTAKPTSTTHVTTTSKSTLKVSSIKPIPYPWMRRNKHSSTSTAKPVQKNNTDFKTKSQEKIISTTSKSIISGFGKTNSSKILEEKIKKHSDEGEKSITTIPESTIELNKNNNEITTTPPSIIENKQKSNNNSNSNPVKLFPVIRNTGFQNFKSRNENRSSHSGKGRRRLLRGRLQTSTIPPTPKIARPFLRYTPSPNSTENNLNRSINLVHNISELMRNHLHKTSTTSTTLYTISTTTEKPDASLPSLFQGTDFSAPVVESKSPENIVLESLTQIMKDATNRSREKVSEIAADIDTLNKELAKRGIYIIRAEIDGQKLKLRDQSRIKTNLTISSTVKSFLNSENLSNDYENRKFYLPIKRPNEKSANPPSNATNEDDKQVLTSVKTSFSYQTSKPLSNDRDDDPSDVSFTTAKTKFIATPSSSIKSPESTTKQKSLSTLPVISITTHRPALLSYNITNITPIYNNLTNLLKIQISSSPPKLLNPTSQLPTLNSDTKNKDTVQNLTFPHEIEIINDEIDNDRASDNEDLLSKSIEYSVDEEDIKLAESRPIGHEEVPTESKSNDWSHLIYIGPILGILPLVVLAAVFIKRRMKRNNKALPDHEEHSEGFTPITHHHPRKAVHSPILPRPDIKYSLESSKLHRPSLWEFPRSDLRLVSILGEGNFGVVWKAEARNLCGLEDEDGGPTVLVAVKGVKEGAGTKEKQDLLQEFTLMKHLGQHPNVVTLLGCCTQQEPHLVIMEYVMWGKLLTFLRDHRSKHNYYNFSSDTEHLTSQDLTEFSCQIATGCDYLQSKGIIHRDLAARNILVDHKKVCKIADFGLARNVKDLGSDIYEQKSRGALPIRWMAPESLYMNIFTHKSDVWSFGILCWEIVTLGSTPYPGLSARDVMRKVREGYRLERPEHCKPELYHIVKKCWHQDLNERPSFSQLKVELAELLDHQFGYIDLENFPESSYFSMLQNNEEKL